MDPLAASFSSDPYLAARRRMHECRADTEHLRRGLRSLIPGRSRLDPGRTERVSRDGARARSTNSDRSGARTTRAATVSRELSIRSRLRILRAEQEERLPVEALRQAKGVYVLHQQPDVHRHASASFLRLQGLSLRAGLKPCAGRSGREPSRCPRSSHPPSRRRT